MNFTAKTRLLTLLGDPILHSKSPEIQNRAFEAAGVDGGLCRSAMQGRGP